MKNYLKESGNIHLSFYLEAADILNIDYEIVVHKLLARFEYNKKHWFIINTVTPLVTSTGKTIASRKDLCNIVLAKNNIPVPKQASLPSVDAAKEFFGKYKKVVIKPKQGIGGKGVSILPSNLEEVQKSYEFAKQSDKKNLVLGEEYIEGDNFRFLTLDKEVIGIVKRLPPTIVGDGKNSIQNLIIQTNPKIPIDYETQKVLESQGLNLKSIPQQAEKIVVRRNTNLTTGGKTQEWSQQVHPYYKDLATKAIKAVGIKLGGVDIIAKDITKPDKCAINEINYNPGLRIHYQVDEGEKVKVAIPIMQYLRDNEL